MQQEVYFRYIYIQFQIHFDIQYYCKIFAKFIWIQFCQYICFKSYIILLCLQTVLLFVNLYQFWIKKVWKMQWLISIFNKLIEKSSPGYLWPYISICKHSQSVDMRTLYERRAILQMYIYSELLHIIQHYM